LNIYPIRTSGAVAIIVNETPCSIRKPPILDRGFPLIHVIFITNFVLDSQLLFTKEQLYA